MKNRDLARSSPRANRLAAIQRSLDRSQRLFTKMAQDGAPSAALEEIQQRIDDARATLDSLRREAGREDIRLIADQLARWIGNLDLEPPRNRATPRRFDEPRRRD